MVQGEKSRGIGGKRKAMGVHGFLPSLSSWRAIACLLRGGPGLDDTEKPLAFQKCRAKPGMIITNGSTWLSIPHPAHSSEGEQDRTQVKEVTVLMAGNFLVL